MSINDLLLQNNKITQLSAIWKGMKKPPSNILLFDNPLTQISDVTIEGLIIYLNCDKLHTISGPIGRNSTLKCVPSRDFVFKIPYNYVWKEFAKESGYSCTKTINFKMTCKPCPPGCFLEFQQFGEYCSKCPPGSFYQDQMGQLQCKHCTFGQFVPPEKAPGKSPLECMTCPEGTRTNGSAGYRACRCLNGFSRRYRFGSCTKCEAKGIQCQNDYQTLRSNFWWSWDYDRTCLTKYLAFVDNVKTESDSYHRNSSTFSCAMPKAHLCLNKGVCLGGIHAKCRNGYTGPLCALCQKGYYKHFKQCTKCPQVWIVFLQVFVYVLLFAFLCALVNWADKLIVNLSNGKKRSLADVILSTMKIILGFYQVLNGTLTSFSYIQWPKTLNTALQVFKFIELEIFRLPSLRCVKYNWKVNALSDFWISLIGTALVLCVINLYYITRRMIFRRRCRTRLEFIAKSGSCKKTCFRGAMIFLF